MLSASDIVVGYEPGNPVLRGTSLEIHPGEVVGLAGPSGIGKSTLAKVMCFLLQPEQGTVAIDGQEVTRFGYRAPRAQRTSVGVVFQSPRRSVDPRLTVRELIMEPLLAAKVAAQHHAERMTEAIEMAGLTDELLRRRPHEVSDGQLQRACVARAIVLRPTYLVCDEMTAMLDAPSTATLVRAIRAVVEHRGTGVLAISHDEDLLGVWADRIVWLDEELPQPLP